jgi:hypothetical protein
VNRAEHLQWAKDRALAFLEPPKVVETIGSKDRTSFRCDDGHEYHQWPPPIKPKQLSDACASIMSDLRKHPDIDPTAASMVYAMEVFSGGLNTVQKVRDFINGIN